MTGHRTGSDPGGVRGLEGATVFGQAFSPGLPDWCTPLDDPHWVMPEEASLMRDEDTVLGFEAAGSMWAIPWWVMKNHHVANLTLKGRAFLVTLCEACVAGGVFDPMLGGRRRSFQLNGWYQGSPLMTDDRTGSLWALSHGRCLVGPSEGEMLPARQIVHAPWREWMRMYPASLVVHGEGEPRDGHGAEFEGPDHQLGGGLRLRGISVNELVIYARLGKSRRGYRLSAVHEHGGIVEDTLGGHPIVVLALPGTWLCGAFVRVADGRSVHLRWDYTENRAPELVDQTSGRRFDLWGRSADQDREVRLSYVHAPLKKWYSCVKADPDAVLWQPTSAPSARATVS